MRINQRINSLEGSTTLAITARAKELSASGHDVVNFGAGEPDFDTPDFIKDAAIEAIKKGFTKYTPSTGTQPLKEAISRKFKSDNQLTYAPNQIVVSCGAKHCLYNLIQALVSEGEEVMIPAPYWVSYPQMVTAVGGKSVIIPARAEDNFKIKPEQIVKNISSKTRVFILNSPSNPTGIVYTKKELEAIAEICVKHGIFVISDEIYEKLIYENESYTSIASLGEDIYQLTATVNGVSKTYAMTGWRIGYLAVRQEVADAIKKFQDHTTSNPASISQAAALAALNAPAGTVLAMCQEFKKRRDLMMRCLDSITQISYIRPQGAFYMFCDISKLGMDSEAFAKKILEETDVALIPGKSFGAPGYVRLSFATSQERIQEGVKRIGVWIKKHC